MTTEEIQAKVLELSRRDDWNIDTDVQDEELLKALHKYNLVYMDRNKEIYIKSPAKNRINPEKMPVATQEQIQAFQALELEEGFDCLDKKFVVSKMAGDEYAQILTPDGKEIVAFVKFIQDTRYPWLNIEGDNRPAVLKTTERSPSKAVRVSNWHLTKEVYGGKIHKQMTYDGISLWNFDGSAVRLIREHLPKSPYRKTTTFGDNILNNMSLRKYITSSIHHVINVGGIDYIIKKEKNEKIAQILLNDEEIGQGRITGFGPVKKPNVVFTVANIQRDTKKVLQRETISLIHNPKDERSVSLVKATYKDFSSLDVNTTPSEEVKTSENVPENVEV